MRGICSHVQEVMEEIRSRKRRPEARAVEMTITQMAWAGLELCRSS